METTGQVGSANGCTAQSRYDLAELTFKARFTYFSLTTFIVEIKNGLAVFRPNQSAGITVEVATDNLKIRAIEFADRYFVRCERQWTPYLVSKRQHAAIG